MRLVYWGSIAQFLDSGKFAQVEDDIMSRIESEELSCMDAEWYAVDQKGNIAVFCSAGVANVPEFVCSDFEKYELLIEAFGKMPTISETIICFKECEKYTYPVSQVTVSEGFSGKGLYYFDSDDNTKSELNIAVLQEYYTLQSKPAYPLKYDDLPIELRDMLKDNFLSVNDFDKVKIVEIENV